MRTNIFGSDVWIVTVYWKDGRVTQRKMVSYESANKYYDKHNADPKVRNVTQARGIR